MLTEGEDSDTLAAFPQSVRYRALQEAVIAIARLRPDQFATRIDLAYDAASDSYKLPSSHDVLISVLGMRVGGKIRSLRAVTDAELTHESSGCWRAGQDTPVMPQHFVWSPGEPRTIYVDGYQPTGVLVVTASKIDVLAVDGNATSLALPYSFFPELIDFAMSRLYARQDGSIGDAAYYLSRFRSMIDDRLNSDGLYNPLVQAMRRERR